MFVRAHAASNCSVGSLSVDRKLTKWEQTSVYDLLQRRVMVPRRQLPEGRRKEHANTWSEFPYLFPKVDGKQFSPMTIHPANKVPFTVKKHNVFFPKLLDFPNKKQITQDLNLFKIETK